MRLTKSVSCFMIAHNSPNSTSSTCSAWDTHVSYMCFLHTAKWIVHCLNSDWWMISCTWFQHPPSAGIKKPILTMSVTWPLVSAETTCKISFASLGDSSLLHVLPWHCMVQWLFGDIREGFSISVLLRWVLVDSCLLPMLSLNTTKFFSSLPVTSVIKFYPSVIFYTTTICNASENPKTGNTRPV